jgi:ATP-dependent metalloprotease
VPIPDVRGREQILTHHAKAVPLASDVNLKTVARGTPGLSGADLANLINQAALKASMEGKTEVGMHDMEFAKDKILMGAERKSAVIDEENRKIVAFHEGGHALVAMYTPGAMPIHKATIMPRGSALGMVSQLPEKDELSWTKKQLFARLDVAMGGRAAEEMMFGSDNVTSGLTLSLFLSFSVFFFYCSCFFDF